MSEYQYYEFQAIDRPLGEGDRHALRALSTRARMTATSFTNSYEWGDFKGDPAEFMERWFDLHLYLANWGSRRLMIRLPKRLIDRRLLDRLVSQADCVDVRVAGADLILDIARDEVEADEDWDDGSDWLAALAPLRADLLARDLRLFYLLWLTAVEADVFEADDLEPMPGIGPMTGALEAFAAFFGVDPDLVRAAAERSPANSPSPDAVRTAIAAMSVGEKTAWLMRLFDGESHAMSEWQAGVRNRLTDASPTAARTVGELRSRARAIRLARERAKVEKAAAECRRRADEAERARSVRLDAIARRGEDVWREIETEIERRNASGYDKAAALLLDLRTVAEEAGTIAEYARRLRTIRECHARKERLLERLVACQ